MDHDTQVVFELLQITRRKTQLETDRILEMNNYRANIHFSQIKKNTFYCGLICKYL